MSYEYKDELDANNQLKIQNMLAELPVSVDRYITSTARTKSTRTTLTYVRMIRAFFLYEDQPRGLRRPSFDPCHRRTAELYHLR